MPIPKKVEAIQALAVPKTHKQLRQFIGMINFYHDMSGQGWIDVLSKSLLLHTKGHQCKHVLCLDRRKVQKSSLGRCRDCCTAPLEVVDTHTCPIG